MTMGPGGTGSRRAMAVAAIAVTAVLCVPRPAVAQLGSLVSPGPLTRAHASLEGLANCQKCHEPGRQVTAGKCLTCHAPIAQRIASRRGIHRDVKDDCVTCHVEHAGRDAELRPLEKATFDHASETGFPLDGRHAPLARDCARCHKTRSFLVARPECSSCHADVHKGALGTNCLACHSTAAPFAQASQSFDHSRAAFPLTGAHLRATCEKCHVNRQFKGLRFARCTDCHREPHQQKFGIDCTSCHTTTTWQTQKVDHARTAFPLVGRHTVVACAKCHLQSPMKAKPKFARCADCHSDPHRGQFKERCENCHKETGFKGASSFDHEKRTGFPLSGRHAALDCSKCHQGTAPTARPSSGAVAPRTIDFRGLKRECAACHTDAHRGELGTTCASCHTTETFKVTTFTHPRFGEFFGGSHARVACSQCHVSSAPTAPARTGAPVPGTKFRNLSMACASCHKDPHLGQVGTECGRCHDVTGAKFVTTGFSHDRVATFPLTGKHAEVACEKCHRVETGAFPAGRGTARRLTGVPVDCASCHKDPHLGQLSRQCQTCHTPSGFAVTKFTHKGLDAFFVGRHRTLECLQCHKKVDGQFPGGRGTAVKYKVETECSSCHRDAHAGALGSACASCHTPEQWQNPNTAFHKVTTFPLEGKHLAVPCQSCHLHGQIKGTPTRCYDCHWIRRQDDKYQTRLGSDCESCHRPISWTAVNWDHGARTGLALNASHRMLACDSCHKSRVFTGTRPECISCHEKDYRAAQNPNHAAAGFPLACDVCHKPSAPTFAGARFTHDTFSLVGQHATQACASCHRNNVFRGTSRDCFGCHQTSFQRTSSPNHAAAGFSTACESCHRATDTSWTGVSFNHSQFFTLQGVHATQACATCHKNSQYKGTPRDCATCHQADYQRAQSPNHVAAGLPTACESCHRVTDASWRGATFNHASVYPLQGAHGTASCDSCHKNNVYRGTARDCVGCHQADYQRAQNPNHAASGLPTTCEQCHQAGGPGWRSGGFNHSQYWSLQGVHATAACTSCHKNNVYRGTSRDCYTCHQAQYQQTKNPNHSTAGFSTACDACHKNGGPGWLGASVNHSQFWPLLGSHNLTACSSCHRSDQYKGTSRDCYACHQVQYQQTKNPNHSTAGFSTACDACHKNGGPGWKGATFNHSQFFTLQGVHATQACSSCHKNNVYRGTPRDCAGCHLSKYQGARNPNHVSAGFPTTCDTCHRATDTTWSQGRFDHSWFPITSGKHAGNACSACHQDSNNYKSFTCLTCHDRAKTDDKHKGRAGYRYDSAACYSCHPTGRGD